MQASREAIFNELNDLGLSYYAKASNGEYPVVLEEEGRRVTLAWVDGQPILTHTYEVNGVSKEKFFAWCQDYVPNVKQIAPNTVEYHDRGVDGGCSIVHQRLKPGIPFVANRSVMAATYTKKTEIDGVETLVFIMSSKGNEHLVE